MKRKMKQLIGILLSLALVLGLMPGMSMTVQAAIVKYPLVVGKVQVTSENASDVFNDGTVSFTPADGAGPATLTLNGATVDAGYLFEYIDETTGILYTGPEALNIVLEGENIIDGKETFGMGIWVDSEVSVTISGNGTLEASGAVYGIGSAGEMTIENGTVTASASEGGWVNSGIRGMGAVKLKGGIVNASASEGVAGIEGAEIEISGGSVNGSGAVVGIYGDDGNVEITGGSVNATGSMGGIYTEQDVEIRGGSVNVSGGIVAANDVVISNGCEVIAVSDGEEYSAIDTRGGKVKNSITGIGWTNKEGTEGGAAIEVSTGGQTLKQFKKVQFPRKYFNGHSLTLNGDIGVNFYVCLTEEEAEKATVSFTWMKNGKEKTASVEMKNVEKNGSGYKAACFVAASDMDAEITATLAIDGVSVNETDKYSVADYAEVILTDSKFAESYIALENGKDRNGEQRLADLRKLVSEMLVYGKNARAYFDAGAGPVEPAPEASIPQKDYAITGNLPEGVRFDGATLSLRSKTSLSLYFVKENDGPDVELSMDGKTRDDDYEVEQNGNEYIIRIRNIAAARLGDDFTVTVNGSATVTYSPMTYCCLAQASSNVKLVNTVKALYNYWSAAKQYYI